MTAQRRVLVGVDGSDENVAATRRAALEAAAHGACLEVIHAWNFLDQPGPDFDPHYGERAAQTRIEQFLNHVFLDGDQPVDPQLRMINDHPGPALVEASQGVFTLVVGARGLSGIKSLALGSVSQHLVHKAHCPLLIVR